MTIPDDRQLGDALTDASRDVKPVDLWERLREPTSEIAAQQARRYRTERRLGALRRVGLAAAVLLVSLGAFLTLNRVRPLAGPTRAPVPTGAAPRPTLPQAVGVAGVEVGKGGTLRYNLGTYPDTLDPHQASQLEEVQVVRMLYEGLTKLDANLNVVGAAAESWRVGEDGVTWTFTLRPGLKYSDGTPLTAANFEYAIKRAASPQLGAPYQSSTYDIQGAEAYGTANPKTTGPDALKALRDRVAVKALDDRTLQIQTRAPIAYLPSLMSLWITYPVREDVAARGETWWREAKNHIGNGPFVLQELREGQIAVFAPNPAYYDPPRLGRLEFRFIKDSHVAFEAYRQGELDVINVAADDLDAALKDKELSQEIVRYSGSCTIGFLFNVTRPPFDNRNARLAFARAMDRDQYVRDILRGVGRPTTSWIPVGLPDYNPDAGAHLKFDPTAGREAWLKAGYTGEVKLTYGAGSRAKARFEFIADQIRRNLGASVTLDPVESTALAGMSKTLETQPAISLGGWCADYPDPQNWMSVYWDSRAFAARYGYKNETVDNLQRVADAEPDPLRRTQLYQEAEKLVLDDVAVAPLYHSENVFLVKPYVKGYTTTPQDHLLGEFTITKMTAIR